MCISASVSFCTAGLLTIGGLYAVRAARQYDSRYIPLAVFPLLVGIQQAAEGFVWVFETAGQGPVRAAALTYLFFVWVIWPSWVPHMTAQLEDKPGRKKILMICAQAGLFLGLLLYMPNFWQPDWLKVGIVNRSIAYQCTFITSEIMPRSVPYTIYLALIGLPPLFSSHRALKILGLGLCAMLPLTYFFFYYAGISVLCFFAALMTFYILYMILGDRCRIGAPLRP